MATSFYLMGEGHTLASALRPALEAAVGPEDFVAVTRVHPLDDFLVIDAPSESVVREALLSIQVFVPWRPLCHWALLSLGVCPPFELLLSTSPPLHPVRRLAPCACPLPTHLLLLRFLEDECVCACCLSGRWFALPWRAAWGVCLRCWGAPLLAGDDAGGVGRGCRWLPVPARERASGPIRPAPCGGEAAARRAAAAHAHAGARERGGAATTSSLRSGGVSTGRGSSRGWPPGFSRDTGCEAAPPEALGPRAAAARSRPASDGQRRGADRPQGQQRPCR